VAKGRSVDVDRRMAIQPGSSKMREKEKKVLGALRASFVLLNDRRGECAAKRREVEEKKRMR